jgi:four helix bundle protein
VAIKSYKEWEESVPEAVKGDSLWRVEAYRLALFLAEIGWFDVTKLVGDRRTLGLSGQLYRSLGSISANIAEGYSRGTGKDRARFYEYALGSARESRDWYYKARHLLGDSVTNHRLALLTQVIRLLLTMIPQQRGRTLREDHTEYQPLPHPSTAGLDRQMSPELLEAIPEP